MKTDNHTKLAVVAAVLVGLFAVVAVNKYISKRTTVVPTPMASILVATMEIKEGSEIGEEMLGAAEIPFDSLSNMHIALPAKNDPGYQKAFSDVLEDDAGDDARPRVLRRLAGDEAELLLRRGQHHVDAAAGLDEAADGADGIHRHGHGAGAVGDEIGERRLRLRLDVDPENRRLGGDEALRLPLDDLLQNVRERLLVAGIVLRGERDVHVGERIERYLG